MPETMKQCKIQKGATTQTTWLPSKAVQLDKTIRVKEDGEWSEGWKIIEIGAEMPKSMIQEQDKRSRSGKNFRSTK